MAKTLTLQDCLDIYEKIQGASNIYTLVVNSFGRFSLINHRAIGENTRKKLQKYLHEEIICLNFKDSTMQVLL